MTADSRTPDEIRRQMDIIRANLGGEVDGLVSNAQQLVDWRHYVRAFPWGSLGVAAALGYFAVPRRLEITSPDADTLERLAKNNRLVVKHTPRGEEKRGLLMSVANLTGNMLLRAGLAYVGQQIGKIVGDHAAQPSPEGVHVA
ncbi:MAG: hypothetical protein KDA86_03850 [Planctomycetaceae bacterium]|nr:hypothetical protein [Planctomycetaceae bacterium]MCA9110776.1 hypothetical protein [Planctomycetaceae bacterium]